MDWLDAHSAGVQAVATLVLVVITAYSAWTSRVLAREVHIQFTMEKSMTADDWSAWQATADHFADL